MTKLDIINYNQATIRKKSKALRRMTPDIMKLIKNMLETMYDHNGVGLAAIQVGVTLRLFVFDISEERNNPQVMINPKIVKKEGKKKGVEGCLSVPGLEGEVERFTNIVVKAKNLEFKDVEIEAEDFLAIVFQHEIDHLDGVLYIDKVIEGTLKPVDEKHKEDEIEL
jgi:peptide deformylase